MFFLKCFVFLETLSTFRCEGYKVLHAGGPREQPSFHSDGCQWAQSAVQSWDEAMAHSGEDHTSCLANLRES